MTIHPAGQAAPTGKKRRTLSGPPLRSGLWRNRVFSGDSAGGANALASAAVDAAASVDLHVIVAHGDSAHGAGGLTSAAGHAGIVDCMCHVKYTSIFRVRTTLIVA